MASTVSETPVTATFTAEQLLLRLLDLIKSTNSADELTMERVSAAMQQPALTFGPGHFGYGDRLTPEWGFGLEVNKAGAPESFLDLNFIDTTPEKRAGATDICKIDFDQFASELAAAGFIRETVWGEHGRVSYYHFSRPSLSIRVVTIGEDSTPLDKITHDCVRRVTVR